MRAGAPVTAGYLPAAVAFGVAAREAGLSVFEAVFMAATVYSGASQFALVGLISSGAPALVAGVSALLLSLRHVLYGPALAPSLRYIRGWRVGVVAYGLTDEIFAVALGRLRQRQANFGWKPRRGCPGYRASRPAPSQGLPSPRRRRWSPRPSPSPCQPSSWPCSYRSYLRTRGPGCQEIVSQASARSWLLVRSPQVFTSRGRRAGACWPPGWRVLSLAFA